MGYDDNECLICYCRNYGNNPIDDDDEEGGMYYVCMNCLGTNLSDRVTRTLTRTRSDKCELCDKECLVYEILACHSHFTETAKKFIQEEREFDTMLEFVKLIKSKDPEMVDPIIELLNKNFSKVMCDVQKELDEQEYVKSIS